MGVSLEDVKKRMAQDEEFVKSLASNDSLQSEIAAEVAERVKGEMELNAVGKSTDEREYTQERAEKDLACVAKSLYQKRNPEEVAKDFDHNFVTKDVLETDGASAGRAIPTPLRDKIVEILDSEPKFLEAGPLVEDMGMGKMDIGVQNQDPSAQWDGEGESINASDPALKLLKLSPHRLTARTDISNAYLARDKKIMGQSYISGRLMKAAKNKLDGTLLEGVSDADAPDGLLDQVDSNQTFTSNENASKTITNKTQDIKDLKAKLAEQDVPEEKRAWFMHPLVWNDFKFALSSGEEAMTLRQMMDIPNKTLDGDPVYTTTNIDLDGSDLTNIYYVEMSEQMVGVGQDFQLDSSKHEKFSNNLTVLKLVSYWDYQMLHDKSAAVSKDYKLDRSV